MFCDDRKASRCYRKVVNIVHMIGQGDDRVDHTYLKTADARPVNVCTELLARLRRKTL